MFSGVKKMTDASSVFLTIARSADGSTLTAAFSAPGVERVPYLSLPITRIIGLVSAVGVHQIKARLLLVPAKPGGTPQHFSLALFAADARGERVSAYYAANPYQPATAPAPGPGGPLPAELAAIWLANWAEAAAITPALFATSYGPLQGYNFEVKDFVAILASAQPFGGQELHLHLSLHEYYAATTSSETPTPTQTFGLVLQLHSPEQGAGPAAAGAYYDMAAPSPPNH